MTNRREFVRSCATAGLLPVSAAATTGQPAERSQYQLVLNNTTEMDLLGHPRCWSAVERELHPFTPERVMIDKHPGWSDYQAKARLLEYVAELQEQERVSWREQMARCRAGSEPACSACSQRLGYADIGCYYWQDYQPWTWFTKSKFEHILGLTTTLTDYYRVPHAECWAKGMIGREMLGSTGIGCGVALPHQYQGWTPTPVPVCCPPADWWLFLYPGGIDWCALDEQPVYALFTLVFRHGRQDPNALSHMCLLSRLLKNLCPDEHTAQDIAKLGRLEVCRLLNHTLARCLDTAKS